MSYAGHPLHTSKISNRHIPEIMSSSPASSSISRPKGKNMNWQIISVENLPASIATQCLSFICGIINEVMIAMM